MYDLRERLNTIHSRIVQSARRAGRDPSEIQLIAVTKNIPVEAIREVMSIGIRHIGENKVQEALAKWKELRRTMDPSTLLRAGDPRLTTIQWHFIGHLQTNKVRDAVQVFDWIHSVDSLRLAEKINQECQRIQKIMPVLIEVNVSGEQSKYGVRPEELPVLLEQTAAFKTIRIEGLMTMAPVVSDPNQARSYFQQLTRLRDQLKWGLPPFSHLSMGMSQDFEVAIEEGATMVRIGTAIFGDRSR